MAEKGRVIVVGAGLAGVTCATLAARGGRQVTLLERAGRAAHARSATARSRRSRPARRRSSRRRCSVGMAAWTSGESSRLTLATILGITRGSHVVSADLVHMNGMVAVLVTRSPVPPRVAPRALLTCDVDASGAITRLYTVLTTAKLAPLL